MNYANTLNPTAKVGQSYSSTLAVSGGTAPYRFAMAAGSLPQGLLLNALTGEVHGTPVNAGVVTGVKIKVTDSAGASFTNQPGFQFNVSA